MSDNIGARKAVKDVEPQLRAALEDVLKRFGGKASIEIELPHSLDLMDDQSWEGNIYKYSF